MIISKTKAINSKRVLVIDGPYTIISGPDSIIHTQEAVISAVETIISATEMDFFKADAINSVVDTTIPAVHTIISAFPTSFFAAEIIISAGGAEMELVGFRGDLKLDDSCISDPKFRIGPRTSPSNFKISDFGSQMQESSNIKI